MKRQAPTTAFLYQKYKRMIYAWAWKIHRRTHVPLDELISEGNLIFVKALRNFRSGEAEFGTVLYTYLHNGLLTFSEKWKRQIPETMEELPDDIEVSPQEMINLINLQQVLQKLSIEAKSVVHLLLESPNELLASTGAFRPKLIRGALRRHLREVFGWSPTKIQKVFTELRFEINNL